jgi:hypothetical protein
VNLLKIQGFFQQRKSTHTTLRLGAAVVLRLHNRQVGADTEDFKVDS